MALTEKYKAVADFAKANGIALANFHEENGALVVNGTAPTPYLKVAIFDKMKEASGLSEEATLTDVKANITVADDSVFHRHTVESGDTLGAIAKTYLGAPGKYMAIFEANRDILSDPDKISVGQVLVIPNA